MMGGGEKETHLFSKKCGRRRGGTGVDGKQLFRFGERVPRSRTLLPKFKHACNRSQLREARSAPPPIWHLILLMLVPQRIERSFRHPHTSIATDAQDSQVPGRARHALSDTPRDKQKITTELPNTPKHIGMALTRLASHLALGWLRRMLC